MKAWVQTSRIVEPLNKPYLKACLIIKAIEHVARCSVLRDTQSVLDGVFKMQVDELSTPNMSSIVAPLPLWFVSVGLVVELPPVAFLHDTCAYL